ncbi:MAG: hypothetical protein CM1200mP16_14520 [Nitrospina sp.]|nr:MAG: hypothetical protein CM1200mP16_14520 [Nitrospina sp.]
MSPYLRQCFPPQLGAFSPARATAVLRYFIDRGAEPERMTATGYADTFFPFGKKKISRRGELEKRRVEFVLEKKIKIKKKKKNV